MEPAMSALVGWVRRDTAQTYCLDCALDAAEQSGVYLVEPDEAARRGWHAIMGPDPDPAHALRCAECGERIP